MIATAPPRPPGTPAWRARRRRDPSTARTKAPETVRHSAWSHASTYRRRCGRLKTHCRTGAIGNTSSTRCAARSAIRLPPQFGQTARLLQENGTKRSSRQRAQRNPREPTRQEPAAQEALELLLDEPRERIPLVDTRRLGAERVEVV